ncbi:MAG: RDD family protein [Sphingomonas sp.]
MASRGIGAGAASRFERQFVTPEGVDLRLTLGSASARATAFLIDVTIIVVVLIVLTLGLAAMSAMTLGASRKAVEVLWLLGFFVLRNGYFLGFELGARGATLGKRMLGLRVVARDGGRLTGEAVIARNALRELEIVLPVTFLAYLAAASENGELTWIAVLLWVIVFLFFPLFNRDRLRVGDLIAGTWVVRAPRRRLGHSVVRVQEGPRAFAFTEAQLQAYGEYELKALEDVLRREDELAVIVVARTIRQRIAWTGGEGDDLEFLKAYYAALCARLERNLLFGKRRADKFHKG